MAAMFANSRAAQGTNSGHLLEIKAGRSNLQPGSATEKRKVLADKTKGLLFIKQSNDQLMHFCWKNRQTGAVIDDLIIFPGDTEFMKVKECPDGRVYMLKFKSSQERRLFWIQDGNTEADKDLATKVNDLLNKPPVARAAARGTSSESRISSSIAPSNSLGALSGHADEMGALGGLDQNQLMQLLSLMNQSGGSTESSAIPATTEGTSTTTAGTTTTQPTSATAGDKKMSSEEMQRLQSLLAGLKPGSSKNTPVDLSDVLKGDRVIQAVKRNKDRFTDKVIDVADSAAHTNVDKEIEETVRQPQFQQAAGMFGYAFGTGQLAPVLEQFGMPAAAVLAAANGDAAELAKALTAEAEGAASGTGTSDEGTATAETKPRAELATESAEPAAAVAPDTASSEDEPKEPEPKRGKTEDDQMDLD